MADRKFQDGARVVVSGTGSTTHDGAVATVSEAAYHLRPPGAQQWIEWTYLVVCDDGFIINGIPESSLSAYDDVAIDVGPVCRCDMMAMRCTCGRMDWERKQAKK